jgi:XTP/dITP diphosphohydrolase
MCIRDSNKKIESEFGDLLFSIINAARLYGIDPESALERTNRKFIKRFSYLEGRTMAMGKSLRDMSLAEMDLIWDEAKKADD